MLAASKKGMGKRFDPCQILSSWVLSSECDWKTLRVAFRTICQKVDEPVWTANVRQPPHHITPATERHCIVLLQFSSMQFLQDTLQQLFVITVQLRWVMAANTSAKHLSWIWYGGSALRTLNIFCHTHPASTNMIHLLVWTNTAPHTQKVCSQLGRESSVKCKLVCAQAVCGIWVG